MNTKFATCRHTKTNGRVCQSPALTGGAFCYFHNKLRQTHRRPADPQALTSGWQEYSIYREDPSGEDIRAIQRAYPHQDEIQFPPLEDAESVQLATSMLFQAIATGQIQFRRARLLIATLKIACINQRALTASRAADAAEPGCPMFDEVDHGVTHSPTQPTSPQSAANPDPSISPAVSLKLPSPQLGTHPPTPNPTPNPNQQSPI